MNELLEMLKPILNYVGISVDNTDLSVILQLSLYYFIMSTFVLLNVLNICFYLLSIYIVSHEKFLSKIPVKYVRIHKLINFYKNIRISFIIIETIMLLFCLIIMIGLSYGLLSFFLTINNN